MTDKEIVERAKEAEKRTGFGELVHSPISKNVNSAFGIGFIEGMIEYRNSLQEEPVSEEWIEELRTKLDSLSKEDFEKVWKKYGAEEKEESTIEDLEEAAENYATTDEVLSNGKVMINFQAEKAFRDGANWQKEQFLAKAVDAEVHIDAGGYPYIPQIELYDYDKDEPLAKEGDVVKVLIIKK